MSAEMSALGKHHIIIKFGDGIDSREQAQAMMNLERLMITTTGKPIEVFKETMADDSKLRNMMTDEQRAKL